jgi:hypothetical protein
MQGAITIPPHLGQREYFGVTFRGRPAFDFEIGFDVRSTRPGRESQEI